MPRGAMQIGLFAAGFAAAVALPNDIEDMDLQDLVRDPERMRQLVPPELMLRFGGGPEWEGQPEEERTARLRDHLASDEGARHDRRLQWMWEESDEHQENGI